MRKWLVILGVGALSLWGLDGLLPRDGVPLGAAPVAAESRPSAGAGAFEASLAQSDSAKAGARRAPFDALAVEADAACSGDCGCLGPSERVWQAARSRPLRSAVAEAKAAGEPAAAALAAGDRQSEGVAPANLAVEGEVVDRLGKAVVNAQVMLLDSNGGRFEVSSDAAGKFRFAVPRGDYVAVAGGEGILPGHAPVVAGAPVRLVVVAPQTLDGRVLAFGAAAGAGAEIELASGGCRRRLRAGDDGQFHFEGLAPGAYELTAAMGARRAHQTVEVGREGEAQKAVELLLDER